MHVKAVLFCATGAIGLYFLSVQAQIPTEIGAPPGWSLSDSIGKQYRLGYDRTEGAYYIENIGAIENVGRDINEKTLAPEEADRAGRVPYSERGFLADDQWAAAIAQSVSMKPYLNRWLTVTVEVKFENFNGKMASYILHAGDGSYALGFPNEQVSGWQTITAKCGGNVEINNLFTIGISIRGYGRVLFRNVKIISEPYVEEIERRKYPMQAFGDPEPKDNLVNMELRPELDDK